MAATTELEKVPLNETPVNVEAESKPMTADKGKAGVKSKTVDPESWDPADFLRDASYFSVACGLPSEGLNPHKITDIDDQQLKEAFGEKSRNGYKLANSSVVPVEDIQHLSQIVDGYERPVNGVLSHSFVKGVYAERVQKRAVNWAAYAAAKLKGQIGQHQREKRAKPEGPPCVRKARVYKPPLPDEHDAETKDFVVKRQADSILPEQVTKSPGVVSSNVEQYRPKCCSDDKVEESPVQDLSKVVARATSGLVKPDPAAPLPTRGAEKPPQNLILNLLSDSILASSLSERQIRNDIARLETNMNALKAAEVDAPRMRQDLDNQVEKLQQELADTGKAIEAGDADILSLMIDIELEGEKEESDEPQENSYLSILEGHQASTKQQVDDLRRREFVIHKEIEILRGVASKKERTLAELPKKVAKVERLQSALLTDLQAVLEMSGAQKKEQTVVAAILEKPCPKLSPRLIPTSTRIVGTQISLTSCPICCNGYHCYNWIPASCGHTYHPSCLFAMIGDRSTGNSPTCFACGELFNYDWLRSWGLDEGVETPNPQWKRYVDEMRDCYGKHSGRLGRRRDLASQIQSVQERGDLLTENLLPNTCSLEGTSIIDLLDDDFHGSSKIPLLTPKLEPDSSGEKRKAQGDSEARKPIKKSKGRRTPF